MNPSASFPLHHHGSGTQQPPWQRLLPGLGLAALLAALALGLAEIAWLSEHGLSALSLAIVLGMALGHTVYPRIAARSGAGVDLSKGLLLRLGIVLYGLRLTLQDLGQVGLAGLLIDSLVLGSTFGLAYLLGTRWLGLDRATSLLIGAGSSICGAAAVLAAGPVLRARAEQLTVAVATVVVFGTLAIFLYPLLHQLNQAWAWLPGGERGFGIYVGATVHEVAQVVAVGRSLSPEAADAAVIAKMLRVMLLAPVLLALSAWMARGQPGAAGKPRLAMPWFAFGFAALVCFNSLQWLPPSWVAALCMLDTFLLAMAMAALGLSTHFSVIRKAGSKPLLLGLVLFAWLLAGGSLIHRASSLLLA
ncbi:putative integral membrane protein (TIGR00698 family) [Paucibacter oligotrophus]|uniref:Putative integral membrane protein (TIGR00698 family) n=1 Tax=Roseateles oligotrophus TaxID=1769250 RepID=A0A840L5H0_9BURK|nr:YeiH family protein [Roseateles oligotrophus]MBB4843266.1 putative integral membrane protein (TIGR00698 family) [Roseateles oligotrophus]